MCVCVCVNGRKKEMSENEDEQKFNENRKSNLRRRWRNVQGGAVKLAVENTLKIRMYEV